MVVALVVVVIVVVVVIIVVVVVVYTMITLVGTKISSTRDFYQAGTSRVV